MIFVAMNHFDVDPARTAEFEARWRERETFLEEVPGFLRFALLRGDEPGAYVSHSTWESRAAFEAWTRSDEFKHGHAQSGRLPQDAFLTHPKLETFDVVINARHGEILAEGAEVGE